MLLNEDRSIADTRILHLILGGYRRLNYHDRNITHVQD